MAELSLNVELFNELRPEQDLDGFNVSAGEVMGLLSMYDPHGIWRLDLESGHVFWSHDVFEIHGLEPKPGPVNLNDAINSYHPEDAKLISQLIENCIEKKTGYRFVLRLKKPNGGYRLVTSVGRYRERVDGTREVFGLFSRASSSKMPSLAVVE